MKFNNILITTLGISFLVPTVSLAGTTLNAAGATFPAPLYQRWFQDYSRNGNNVNYQSVGSSAGIRQFIAGTVDFAATDEPISSKDASRVKRGVIQFPATAGTISVAYNKKGCNLKLSQSQVIEIFNGSIKDWKVLGCSPGKISVVYRSDGSGTTFAFTSALKEFGGWNLGVGKSINWPVGIGGKGNEGVAGVLTNNPGSIGYVSTSFVKNSKVLKSAAIQNKSGKYVLPNYKTGLAALNDITLDNKTLAGENFNPSGANAYPITTLTWIIAYNRGYGKRADEVRNALNYMLSNKAQMIADDLGFIPLAGSILNRARIKVSQITN